MIKFQEINRCLLIELINKEDMLYKLQKMNMLINNYNTKLQEAQHNNVQTKEIKYKVHLRITY